MTSDYIKPTLFSSVTDVGFNDGGGGDNNKVIIFLLLVLIISIIL